MLRLLLTVLVLCATAVTAHAQAPKSFKVIVNSRGPIDALKRADAEALFLKKTSKVKDVGITPYDQPLDSATRQRFSEVVMQRSPRTVHAFWQQRLFTGQGVPPKEVKDDAAAIAVVATNAGAISYVAAETAVPDSVRVITISD